MAITPRPPMVVPPTQATPAAEWPDAADAFVTSQYEWTVAFNEQTIPEINQAIEDVDNDATASGLNAQAAQQSATLAGQHKDAASVSAGQAVDAANAAGISAASASGSASSASSSAGAAAGSAVDAEQFKSEAQEFRDEAQQFRDEAQEIVIGSAIDDAAITLTQVRSSFNDAQGNFANVDFNASGNASPLTFAKIKATGAAVTITPTGFIEGQLLMVGNLTSRLDHRIVMAKLNGKVTDGHIVLRRPWLVVTFKFINPDYGWSIV